ncbi:MAG: histidine phosphatase family protein [Polyangiaceae bacterium]
MGRIFLARHGETDFNKAGRLQGRSDIPLNETGRAQASRLAERVRDLGIVRAGASSLVRARETASICAAALGVPCDYEDAELGERHYGVFEGLTRDELLAKHADAFTAWQADNRHTPEGGEAYDALAERMKRGIVRALVNLPSPDGTLLVSHGGAMRALVFSVTGELVAPLPNAAVLRIDFDGHTIQRIVRLDV